MKKILLLITALIIFFLSPLQTSAASKSYYFPLVKITIQINKDGSIDWTETRTFSFNGAFSRIYWDIPLTSSQTITNVSIKGYSFSDRPYQQLPAPDDSRPAGYFAANRNGNTFHIEAYHSSDNETKTFLLTYHLTGAITKYQDVAEFYWKVIGDGWDARTDKAEITTILPQAVDKNQINIFGHGPLNGQATIVDGKTAQFTVSNLPANQWVEIREEFPSHIIQGPSTNTSHLETVRQEEKRFQQITYLTQVGRLALIVGIVIGLIFWGLYWYRKWVKYGKEYPLENVPKYVNFPPSKLAPALVEALVSQNQKVTPNSFSATILDLARRKFLTFDVQEEFSNGFLGIGSGMKYHYTFTRTAKTDNSLLPFEQDALDFLFQYAEDGTHISLDDFKKEMKSHPSATSTFFTEWKATVKQSGDALGFLEKAGSNWRWKFTLWNSLVVSVALLLVFYALGVNISLIGVFIYVIAGIAFISWAISTIFLRWNKSYELQAKEWQSFKHYLVDFSDFKNELPNAVIIWEDMLVYGTALGVADKVIEYLPIIFQKLGHSAYPSWYVLSSSNGQPIQAEGLNVDFASQLSTSMTSLSTSLTQSFSSGSGGGFSGGGGSGGGGGGGGAD